MNITSRLVLLIVIKKLALGPTWFEIPIYKNEKSNFCLIFANIYFTILLYSQDTGSLTIITNIITNFSTSLNFFWILQEISTSSFSFAWSTFHLIYSYGYDKGKSNTVSSSIFDENENLPLNVNLSFKYCTSLPIDVMSIEGGIFSSSEKSIHSAKSVLLRELFYFRYLFTIYFIFLLLFLLFSF